MDNNKLDHFTQKHKNLLSMANISKVLIWVIAVECAIQVISKMIIFFNLEDVSSYLISGKTVFSYYLSILSSVLDILLSRIFFIFTLNSISLGIKMLVETDLNFRLKNKEVINE